MNHTDAKRRPIARLGEYKGPLITFVAGLIIFGAVSGERLLTPSRDNHYVFLADAMLHGRLHIEGKPPHYNDWAKYEGKWYVSFPPAPAVLMIPGVAIFGMGFNDRLFTLPFAAAGPALLFLLLQLLATRNRLHRRPVEIAIFTALYGVGTVYFFSAVQGTVWYTAHMVGGVFLLLFLLSSLEAKHPILAGIFLAIAFACRPPMALAVFFFIFESIRVQAPPNGRRFGEWIAAAGSRALLSGAQLRRLLLFALPLVVVVAVLALFNTARFDDPTEFGHQYLKVRWSARIARWGLFHYHYLARNLAVVLTSLPWISDQAPYFQVSRHGLALWMTTPLFFWVLWPKKTSAFYTVLGIVCGVVALPSLFYQNTGWVQFGYRFSLDYAVFLVLMLAAGGRRMGKSFWVLCVFAVALNLFGALTFNRQWQHYPASSTHHFFQPD